MVAETTIWELQAVGGASSQEAAVTLLHGFHHKRSVHVWIETLLWGLLADLQCFDLSYQIFVSCGLSEILLDERSHSDDNCMTIRYQKTNFQLYVSGFTRNLKFLIESWKWSLRLPLCGQREITVSESDSYPLYNTVLYLITSTFI